MLFRSSTDKINFIALDTFSISDSVPASGGTFTGNVTVPTPTATGHAVTKAYSDLKAPIASPTFTGEVTAPSLILTPRTVPTSPAPVEGQMYYNDVDNVVYVWNGSAWDQLSNKFSATGGSTSTVGSYKIHTFTSSGTFITGASGSVDVLVVAGGGGGHGGYQSPGGGGGGAGGVIYSTGHSVTAQSYTVTVGGGGIRGQGDGGVVGARPTNGGNSVFSNHTAVGGGKGGGYSGYTSGSGGSAGGEGYGGGRGTATSGQGNAGGGSTSSPSQNAGGGGGKGGVGAYGTDAINNPAGAGGVGQAYSITGSSVYYAGGGGGGGGYNGGTGGLAGGAGGNGGGGVGGTSSGSSAAACTGSNATPNTGGGGGGAGGPVGSIDQTQQFGGNGGSGIVIIRYLF